MTIGEAEVWANRRNQFKQAIVNGGAPIAMWSSIPWPESIEIMGRRGIDAALVDLEHGPFDVTAVSNLARAAELWGVSPIVRLDRGNLDLASRILDLGVQGLIFPHVESGADATECYQATEYAPAGTRGWAGSHSRFALWEGPFAAELGELPVDARGVYSERYKHAAHEFLFRMFLIESPRGVANVREILATGYADAVSFGWGDYSASVDFDLSKCDEALAEVYVAARDAGVGMELHPGHVESGKTPWYPGCFLLAGHDSLVYSRAIGSAADRAKEIAGRASRGVS